MPAIRSVERQDQPSQGRFAAAGLADESERLARADGQADAVDGLHLADGAAQHALAADRESDAPDRVPRAPGQPTGSRLHLLGEMTRARMTGRRREHRRIIGAADVTGHRAARMERASGRQRRERGRAARDRRQPLAARCDAWHRVEQAGRVRMAWRSRKRSAALPLSTMRPEYITAIRSATSALTAEVVRDEQQRHPAYRRATASAAA